MEETIVTKDNKSTKFLFERGKKGVFQKLTEYYNQQPKLFYIGEWHTHPDSSPIPSSIDRQAMKKITEDENVKIISPILIIIGIKPSKYSVGVYIQFNNKLYKYEQQQN